MSFGANNNSNRKPLTSIQKFQIKSDFIDKMHEIYIYAQHNDIAYHDKMKLYGLRKQAIFGNIRKKRPFWCYFMNRYKIDKWESWNEYFNFEKFLTMKLYIEYADNILGTNYDNIINCADF